jgi:DNA-binding CsgD family transcriptional regulator
MASIQQGPTDWPLAGRGSQVALIDATYAAATTAGVVLIGEAGVGKTRLAREAWQRIAAPDGSGQGCPAHWVTATRSAAVVPLGTLAPLLAPTDRTAAGVARGEELDAMARLLGRFPAGARRRPLLAIDDAHLLDEVSAALVFQLASSGRAFVLLTVRAGVAVPDAIRSLWTTGTTTRIEVTALAGEDLDQLLALSLDGPIDALSARELRRICAGSPMLLRELLIAGRDTGSLRQVGGVWRWHGRQYVTSRLVDVVAARLGALPPELLELGELLACGEPLTLPMLETLTSHDAVQAAERRRVIDVELSGHRVVGRLAHPIYADVFMARMPRTRERQVYRQLAEALAETPMRRRDDVLLAALWRKQAGLPSPPDLLLAAAGKAIDRLDLDLAEGTARLARQAGAGERADVLLAEALTHRGRYADAARVLPAQPAEVDGDLRMRWQVARQRIDYFGVSRPGGAGTLSSLAEPDDPAARAAYTWLLVAQGRNRQALQLATAALPACRHEPVAANWAAAGALSAAGLLGHRAHVADVLTPALALADQHAAEVPWGPTQVAATGCLALLATGQLAEARRLADGYYQRAVAEADRLGPNATPIVGACAAIRGIVAKAAGRAGAALAALTEAAALLEAWPTYRLQRIYLAELAATHALTGDLTAAGRRLAEADEQGDAPVPLLDAWVERARAWVTAAEGDLTRAGKQAVHAAALARATEQPAIEALALFDAIRFGEGRQAHDRLTNLADLLRLPSTGALAETATALRSGDAAGALDVAARTLASHGYLLYAAEAATVAHVRHTDAHRRTQAHRSLVRASALAHHCGGARTPLLRSTRLHLVLTSREMQVASLAAAGHSGGKIAAQLGLSPRTVNNYLGRVYQKLGISGRAQLAAVLRESDG